MDFILNIFNSFECQSIIKLILGFMLAGIIGLERSSWNKPAGFRTHALVGISSVLIMTCGEYMSTKYNMDPSRIPAQLLSGIGFIGAGTILREGFNVKGLTTASSLLAVTCIGLSVGAGFYLGSIIATILVYCILSYSYLFSEKLDHFDVIELNIKVEEDVKKTIELVEEILNKSNITISKIMQPEKKDEVKIIKIIGKYRERIKVNEIISNISKLDNIIEVEEVFNGGKDEL